MYICVVLCVHGGMGTGYRRLPGPRSDEEVTGWS